MNRSGIYIIRNRGNGKCYVGSAVNLRKRMNNHRHELRADKHHSATLQRAWSRHGEATFGFSVLLRCDPEHLIFFEQRAFDVLHPFYNGLKVAGSPVGRKHSPEAIAKMSLKAKARGPHSAEHRLKISLGMKALGLKRSQETRAAVSAAQKLRPMTPERLAHLTKIRARRIPHTAAFRAQLAERMMGNTYTLGYKHTAETRAKMSKTRTGMKRVTVRPPVLPAPPRDSAASSAP